MDLEIIIVFLVEKSYQIKKILILYFFNSSYKDIKRKLNLFVTKNLFA